MPVPGAAATFAARRCMTTTMSAAAGTTVPARLVEEAERAGLDARLAPIYARERSRMWRTAAQGGLAMLFGLFFVAAGATSEDGIGGAEIIALGMGAGPGPRRLPAPARVAARAGGDPRGAIARP